MRTRSSLCLILMAAALLAGCRAQSSSAAGPAATGRAGTPGTVGTGVPVTTPADEPTVRVTPIDMCKLLPEADVKATTGLPISGSVAQPRNTNSFVCTYFFGPPALLRLQFDAVFSFNDGGLDSTDRHGFEATQQSRHGESVDGVGKAAFWVDSDKSLHVWTGAGVFFVALQDRLSQPGAPKVADPKAAALGLAREVVPKLPSA